jgi:hypothetical protein
VAVPAQLLAERFVALRAAWLEIAADIATVGPVNELLMQRLDGLEAFGVANEHDLLSIAEDAAQVALQVTTAEGAQTLSKRLRRAVYEYLLAVDAAASAAAFQAAPTVAVVAQPARPGSMMIGLEEVAAVRPQPVSAAPAISSGSDAETGSPVDADSSADADPTAEAGEASQDGLSTAALPVAGGQEGETEQAARDVEPAANNIEAPDQDGYGPETRDSHRRDHADLVTAGGAHGDDSKQFITGGAEPGAEVDATGASLPDVDSPEPGTAAVGDPDSEVAATEPTAGLPQLTVIHPGYALAAPEPAGVPAPPPQHSEPLEAAGEAAASAPLVPAAPRDCPPPPAAVVVPSYRAWADVIASASESPPEPPPPLVEAEPTGPDSLSAVSAELDTPTPVLGDPDKPVLVEVAIVDPQFPEQPGSLVEETAPAPDTGRWSAFRPAGSSVGNSVPPAIGWSVRKSPRQQLLSARMAEKRREQAVRAAQDALSEADKGRRRRDRDQEPLHAGAIPLQVDELIHRKKGADAASLLLRAAQELEMPELVDVATNAGDRLRELGQTKVAISCYLAAWRAAPLNEAPLWRLAEACLADHAVDQAVGYLRRITDLMRARGDDEGAITVYRRIATIAPDNKEVREVLRHLHATGRLLD